MHGIPNGIVPPVAFVISREKADTGEFTLDPMPPGRSLKDQFVLTRIANALGGVTLDDVAPAAELDFESPERVTITYRCFDGLVIEGRLVNARIDRSFIDAEGVRWVIDYKTSRHEGGSLEEFLAAELSRYRPQLARYAQLARELGPEPVRAALYFPLLGAFRAYQPD